MKRVLKKSLAIVLLASMIFTSNGMFTFATGLGDAVSQEENKEKKSSIIAEEKQEEDTKKEEEKKDEEGKESVNDEVKTNKNDDAKADDTTTDSDDSTETSTEVTVETTIEEKEETSTETTETKSTEATEATEVKSEEASSEADSNKVKPEEVKVEKEETKTATASDIEMNNNEDKGILSKFYADYEGVLSINDDSTVITLEKDAELNAPITVNSSITFDLNGHKLTGPVDNYAFIIEDATFTFKDIKHKGLLKGNGNYAVIKANNSTLNFISGVIRANDGYEAINFEDTNVLIIGSEIYGGNGVDDNKGSAAIIGNYTKDEYSFKAVRGLVLGGEGGFNGDENVKGSGGKALVLNGKALERVIGNLPLSTGEIGDIGSADGGHAVVLTGSIKDEQIVLPTANVLVGGSGGKNAKTKSLRITKKKKKKSLFGSNPEDMTVDEITELSSYTTPDKYITSLKDQDFTGWCYTFAHLAMAETYMLKNYWDFCQDHLFNGEFDLSEVATAFFSKEHPSDPLGNAGASREWCDGCYYTSMGGDKTTFVNYASQLRGIQAEEDAVFPDDVNKMYQGNLQKSEKALDIENKNLINLTNYRYTEYTGVYDYTRAHMINHLKESIAKNGSAAVGLTWHSNGIKELDSTHATFAYQKPLEIMFYWQGGHAVQAIGWDDNFSKNNFAITDLYNDYKANEDATIKKYMSNMHDYDMMWGIDLPYDELYVETKEMLDKLALEGDGAFLCKNSHGNYVWVSYYTALDNFTVFDGEFVPAGTYDYAYYYDGGTSPEEIEVFDAYVDFEAKKDNEIIKAISIVSANEMDGVRLTVDKERDEYKDQYVNPMIMKTISLKRGNNFIELSEDEQMNLFKGQKFTVTINAPQTIAGMMLGIDKNMVTNGCNPIHYDTVVSGKSYANCTLGEILDPSQPGGVNINNFNRVNKNYQQLDGNLRIHVITLDENNFKRVFLHCGHDLNTADRNDVVYFRKTGTKEKFSSPYSLTGHEFLYWEDEDGNHYTVNDEVTIGDSDIHLTAKWGPKTYKLDLVDNGASFVDGYTKPTSWKYGEITVFPTEKEMYKPGYKFDGWYEVWNDWSGPKFTQIGHKSWVTGDQEYYAKWDKVAEDDKIYYTLKFLANGGSGAMLEQKVEKGVWTPIKFNEFTAPADDSIGNKNYVFGIWGGTDGQQYEDGQNIRMNSDVTLKAYWNPLQDRGPKSEIKFIAPYIESHMLIQTVNKENKKVKLNASTLKRNGYEFAHWIEIKEDGSMVRIPDRGYVNANSNHVLYARWKKDGVLVNEPIIVPGTTEEIKINTEPEEAEDAAPDYYTVIFKPNGAAEEAYTQKIVVGEGGEKLTPVKFSREGYVFIEWEEETSDENPSKIKTWKDKELYTDSSKTLKAIWLSQDEYDAMQEKINKDKGSSTDGIVSLYYEVKLNQYSSKNKSEYTDKKLVLAGERLYLHQDNDREGYNLVNWKSQNGKTYPNNTFVYIVDDYEFSTVWEKIGGEEKPNPTPTPTPTPAPAAKVSNSTGGSSGGSRSSGGGGGGGGGGGIPVSGGASGGGPLTPISGSISGGGPFIPTGASASGGGGPLGIITAGASGGGNGIDDNLMTNETNLYGAVSLTNKNLNDVNKLNNLTANNTNAVAQTKISVSFNQVPVNTNTANSTWTTDSNGKWQLNVVNASGNVEKAKNTWACLKETATVNGQKIEVQNFYFFDNNGDMLTGWLSDTSGKTYYLGTTSSDMGKMTRGWKEVSGSWYYFDNNGVMLSNGTTPDGEKIGADGKWVKR